MGEVTQRLRGVPFESKGRKFPFGGSEDGRTGESKVIGVLGIGVPEVRVISGASKNLFFPMFVPSYQPKHDPLLTYMRVFGFGQKTPPNQDGFLN